MLPHMASHGRELFVVTPFIFLVILVYGQITVRPRNTLTFIGERTVLECCSHDKNVAFIWKKYLERGRAQRICKRGDDCTYDANYIIEKSTAGCSNLTIVSTSGHDSTFFECTIHDTGYKAAAYVIPYSCRADNNEQSDYVEGDVVTFRCEVLCKDKLQFSSHWMNEHGKIMKWNNFTGGSCVSTWKVSLQKPDLLAYTYILQFFVNPNTADDQFDKSNASITWTSKKEPVAYPVTNINASLQDNSEIQEMSSTCSADGHPSPDYLWLDTDDREIGRGPTLTIKSTETGHYRRQYKCIATNTIRGRQHSKSIVIMVSKKVAEKVCSTDVIPYLNLFSSVIAVLLLSVLSYKLLIKPTTTINVQGVQNQEKKPDNPTEVDDGGNNETSSSNIPMLGVPIARAHSPVQRERGLHADYDTSDSEV